MKIAVMQPYILPYIGYFQMINAVDKFVFYDDVNFIKKGWINRNNFLANGKAHRFTIPLNNVSQNKLILETSIAESNEWQFNLLKTLEQSYKKAPYFTSVFSLIQRLLMNEEKNISTYNGDSIRSISSYLDFKTDFILSSELNKNNALKGSEKILEICKILNADQYINAIGGIDLYSKEDFLKENIELKFIKSNLLQYPQFANDFVPWLSIIDVLMFNSKERIINLINDYTLL